VPNLGLPELLVGAIAIGLLVLWVLGVTKLFQKNHPTLAWVAIVGVILPPLGLVGYSGWFVQERVDLS
jgi:multisubunit Na+/H+ antiporter MnhB subunit